MTVTFSSFIIIQRFSRNVTVVFLNIIPPNVCEQLSNSIWCY